jgi:hypothetical protein
MLKNIIAAKGTIDLFIAKYGLSVRSPPLTLRLLSNCRLLGDKAFKPLPLLINIKQLGCNLLIRLAGN